MKTEKREMPTSLDQYRYTWPDSSLEGWSQSEDGKFLHRRLVETPEDLRQDSRWPAFFPSPICLVTTSNGTTTALEKVVGASIVNRFPYLVTLSFCVEDISHRHHPRSEFVALLEESQTVAIQFLPPGPLLDRALKTILSTDDKETTKRIEQSGLSTRPAVTNGAPIFDDAYLVYEGKFVKSSRDFQGNLVCENASMNTGSHRLFFFEINAIQLRADIAAGDTLIHWRSLPRWSPTWHPDETLSGTSLEGAAKDGYQKPYDPEYYFPSSQTVSFDSDYTKDGMCVKLLPALPEDQVEVDNDRARWPCFFPSSAGMITSVGADGQSNWMPCGSTTMVSRYPLIIAPCICYCGINERYAKRASLDMIRNSKRFGCGVPFIDESVLSAIRYAGNVSLNSNRDKLANARLPVRSFGDQVYLPSLPIHFNCRVVDEVMLGTHVMFLGEVEEIIVRRDLTPENPIEWCPWAELVPKTTIG